MARVYYRLNNNNNIQFMHSAYNVYCILIYILYFPEEYIAGVCLPLHWSKSFLKCTHLIRIHDEKLKLSFVFSGFSMGKKIASLCLNGFWQRKSKEVQIFGRNPDKIHFIFIFIYIFFFGFCRLITAPDRVPHQYYVTANRF